MSNEIVKLVVKIDGETIDLVGPPIVEPDSVDESLYAEDGFSFGDVQGCVRNREVDIYVAQLKVGNEFEQKAAAEAFTHFAVRVPGRDLDRETSILFNRNYSQDDGAPAWFSGNEMAFEEFYPSMGRTERGKVISTAMPIEGFCTPICGQVEEKGPKTVYLTLAKEYKFFLDRQVAKHRRDAERADWVVPDAV